MKNGIISIQAEICITANSEIDARRLADMVEISRNMCKWRQDHPGLGGHLYAGGELFFDPQRKIFTFNDPSKVKQ